MPTQHTTEETNQGEGMVVPLNVLEMRIIEQRWQADGRIGVGVIARTQQAICPECQQVCHKIHDTRARKKRDVFLGDSQGELIVWKRRFRCESCHRRFTEPDRGRGWKRRTTVRLREQLGRQACNQPIAHVAASYGVGPRFVESCLQHVATRAIEHAGGQWDETQPLTTPRYLGIDEFAVHKGHRYETILCDLERRTVLEVSAGRALQEVVALVKRLHTAETVEGVSMDMSALFRPVVKQSLPQAQIVVDHFHVIQHVMKAFCKVLSSWAHKKEGMILLHHKQHLFLRAHEALTQEQQEDRVRIGSHLPVLERAWQLKEAFRTWYATATAETAATLLDDWIAQVKQQGLKPMCKALSAFVHWRQEIRAFFRWLPQVCHFQWICGRQEQSHQSGYASSVWLPQSSASSFAYFLEECGLNALPLSPQRILLVKSKFGLNAKG